MIGIIGGTGLTELPGLSILEPIWHETPYGEPSSTVSIGQWQGQDIAFLARHGNPHQIPPHLINYRANLFALRQSGVSEIIAVNAVGGIHPEMGPACIALPDQVIDYTYGRAHTLYDGSNPIEHIDFSFPYNESLRQEILLAAEATSIKVLSHGVYGATQGPRLETAAEIQRCRRDGCDMIGMTGMPEAALAREMGLAYATIALSVNWAAGLTDEIITMEAIQQALAQGMSQVLRLIESLLQRRLAEGLASTGASI